MIGALLNHFIFLVEVAILHPLLLHSILLDDAHGNGIIRMHEMREYVSQIEDEGAHGSVGESVQEVLEEHYTVRK
jgi:hypothetical protein